MNLGKRIIGFGVKMKVLWALEVQNRFK